MGRPKGGEAKKTEKYGSSAVSEIIEKEIVEAKDEEAIREAIHDMLQMTAPSIKKWLEAVGDDDPLKALTLFKDFSEFVIPKVQRTDSNATSKVPIQINMIPASQYLKEKKIKVKPTSTQQSDGIL